MKWNKIAMILGLAILSSGMSQLSAANVKKIVDKIQKKYQQVKTLKLEFKQKSIYSLTNMQSEVFGTLLLDREHDRYRLETEDQVIVDDGQTFWRYNKLENQVLIDYAKKSEEDVLLSDFLFNLNKKYFAELVSEEKTGKQKQFVIKLTPKNSEESYFKAIKVWVVNKTWEIKKVVYFDINDNQTEFDITSLKINLKIPDSVFKFNPPQGVDVVDLRM